MQRAKSEPVEVILVQFRASLRLEPSLKAAKILGGRDLRTCQPAGMFKPSTAEASQRYCCLLLCVGYWHRFGSQISWRRLILLWPVYEKMDLQLNAEHLQGSVRSSGVGLGI